MFDYAESPVGSSIALNSHCLGLDKLSGKQCFFLRPVRSLKNHDMHQTDVRFPGRLSIPLLPLNEWLTQSG